MSAFDFARRHLIPFGGGVPLLGSVIHAPQALYHLGAAQYDAMTGDTRGYQNHSTSALMHGVEAIPFAGTAASIAETIYNHTGERQGPREPMIMPDGCDSDNSPRDAHGALRDWMFGLPRESVCTPQPAPPSATHRGGERGAGVGTALGTILGQPLQGGRLGARIGEWWGRRHER